MDSRLHFSIEELGISEFPSDDDDYLALLFALIDYQVLRSLGERVSLDVIKEYVPYRLTTHFLRFGIPSNDTILQKLYNLVYNEITYPLFLKHFYNDPTIPDIYHTRAVVEQNSKNYATSESRIAYNYVNNAMNWIQAQGLNNKIDTHSYLNEIKQNPTANRYQLIKKTAYYPIEETSPPYMNFDNLYTNTFQYIDTVSEFESVVFLNALFGSYYETKVYKTKTWIWSGKKHTRHRGMHGETVPVNEPFVVINEMTGEAALLMYPRDYARDSSGANTVNCGCGIKYNTELI